ncbi:hypothetical protein [Actinacidiphila acididurans]|uniref:Uncharacterized protein n=1 Tax=Actinacidiphila acididurans TaxID=2784346 RepID=A0ABS2U7P4_9ACTN|nr:hypothetical protein [Actinacidiphila acididurans]MBM9510188.1 hypothetical protein [Actinacidiphila acididurans]
MIAAVGCADLPADTMELVESELRAALERCVAGAAVLVRAGAGLPVVIGKAVREAGRKLVVLLPAQGTVPAVLPERDRAAARELVLLAEHVRLLPFDPADRNACVSADERLIEGCRHVVAVWDGSPSSGRDATAHLVAFARTRGIPVQIVWPDGAGTSAAPEPYHGRTGGPFPSRE